jgi:PAS domain S-box-containing protein
MLSVSPSVRGAHGLAGLWSGFERSPDAIFVTDRQNRVVCWNRSAEHLLGYAEDEAVGAACSGMLQGSDSHGNRYCFETCPVSQLAARGESIRRFELKLRAKDGATLPVEATFLTLVVDPPERFYVVHILRPAGTPNAASPAPSEESQPPVSQLVVARQSVDARARRLTPREVEVLGMLAAGRTTPEIAERLHISTLTARNHIQNLLDKLEVHSKAEAVAFAFQKHLI